MFDEKQKKILLVHLFSNGDCLYATAIARQIKADFPGAHLTWAIAGFCKNILDGNPYVDHVLETNEVAKNDLYAFRRLKKKIYREQKEGLWDEVFVTLNMDENQAYYDGCIRTGILRAYPRPITTGFTPVLRLNDTEKKNAKFFAEKNCLENYRVRVLFEFAPQSGQLPITRKFAIRLAEKLTQDPDVVVILSSAIVINHPHQQIVDGSILTLRETAALTFYCTHLIGCSSGITWATTADGAKLLPMVQLINPETKWINAVSRDFERLGKSTENIIDLMGLDEPLIEACLQLCFKDFVTARKKYNQRIPLKFITSRSIVYNLLCQWQFKAILKHIAVNREVYGNNFDFYREVLLTFVYFPFKLLLNFFSKKVFKSGVQISSEESAI